MIWLYIGYFFFKVRSVATLKPQWKSEIFYLKHLATPTTATSLHSQCSDLEIFQSVVPICNTFVIEASCLCFQTIPYAGLQLIVPKCCPPMIVHQERDENHREPSPGGWWRLIKHFPSKTIREPLCCSCNMRPSIVMKKDNIWGQHSSSLVLNKGIELQDALHIWRETLLSYACLRAHYELRTDKCDVSRSTGILETFCITSTQNFIWFSRWS